MVCDYAMLEKEKQVLKLAADAETDETVAQETLVAALFLTMKLQA
jgi:hypothetical protein